MRATTMQPQMTHRPSGDDALVQAVADALAAAVGQSRELVLHEDGDLGVHVTTVRGMPRERLDAWVEGANEGEGEVEGSDECCLRVDLLGHQIEVYFRT